MILEISPTQYKVLWSVSERIHQRVGEFSEQGAEAAWQQANFPQKGLLSVLDRQFYMFRLSDPDHTYTVCKEDEGLEERVLQVVGPRGPESFRDAVASIDNETLGKVSQIVTSYSLHPLGGVKELIFDLKGDPCPYVWRQRGFDMADFLLVKDELLICNRLMVDIKGQPLKVQDLK